LIWIPYKLVAGGTAPLKKTRGAAGFDLFARASKVEVAIGTKVEVTQYSVRFGQVVKIPLGVAFEIPVGFVGVLSLRSSGPDRGLQIPNGHGIIDSDYRGEVSLIVTAVGEDVAFVDAGDRVAQILFVPVPEVRLTEVAELTPTERGEGGFGSTGSR
jgi:dUTP pyrophosphatase